MELKVPFLLLAYIAVALSQAAPPGSKGLLGAALGPAAFPDAGVAPAPQLSLTPALSPAGSKDACPTSTIIIYANQLVNQSETSCIQNGKVDGDSPGQFGRNTPFGFQWADTTPTNCTIYTITIAVQAGVSCTGLAAGGQTTLNGVTTPANYRFPYVNEYNKTCDCTPPAYSPIQVFTFNPGSSYCQGCNNTFSILGSTGSNGLRPVISGVGGGIYSGIIINQWVATGFMNQPRSAFAFVTTPLGSALAVGGVEQNALVLSDSDEYNRTTNSWTLSNASMQTGRALLEAANLQNAAEAPDSTGSYFVLAAGGIDQYNNVQTVCDLYNTTSRKWFLAPPMNVARTRFRLTSLYNGTNGAIATGGLNGFLGEQDALNSVEVYDLDTNRWQLAPNMTDARYRHQAVLLPSWAILVIGGQGSQNQALSSTELLDLSALSMASQAGWVTKGPLNQARYAFTATVLSNGSVLIAGGAQKPNSDTTWANSDLLTSCEIYTNGTWYPSGNLTFARADHQAVLMSDGTVLVTGGGGISATSASEIWDPHTGHWIPAAPMLSPRVKFGLTKFSDDSAIAYGGAQNGTVDLINGTNTSVMFTPAFNLTALLASASPAIAPAAESPVPATAPDVSSTGISTSTPAAEPPFSIIITSTSSGISAGAVGGIVGGVVGGLALLAALIFCCWWRRRKARHQVPEASYVPPDAKDPGFPTDYSHPGTDVTTRDPSLPDSASLLKKLSSRFGLTTAVTRKSNGSNLPSRNTVSLPKGIASPFDTTVQPPSVKSPFETSPPRNAPGGVSPPLAAAVANMPLGTQSTGGRRSHQSAGQPSTGHSWDPSTQNTSGSHDRGQDGYETVDLLSARKSSAKTGRSVIWSGSSKSDLSRVSMAIQNELHGAEWKIDRSTLELGKRLGKGGFGEVFQGSHHGSAVAIKVLEINDDRTMLDACHEFGFLHGLRHSKLVVSYGACVEGNNMLLVMELMEEDLFHAIANDDTSSADSVLWQFRGWRIAVDIASALVFLHSKGLVHLDVKSLNILLKGQRTEAKLADLGLAKLVPDGHLALHNTLPGTPAYSAPEVIQAQLQWRLRTQGRKDQFKTEVGTAADVFAFGVVLFELCTGLHPARWRQDFTGSFRADQAPPSIAKLVDDCLQDDPALRPTAQQLLRILLDNKPAHLK